MQLYLNDMLKLHRSYIWTVVLGVPFIAVAFGAGNYAANLETLDQGWDSYWSQALLFYGMLFMSMGIAILTAAVWRVEHRGGNWAPLLTSPRSYAALITSKLATIMTLTILMQLVFLVLSIGAGWLTGLSGPPPASLVGAALFSLIPAVAVASWQSLLSMTIRSFAVPIAIGLVASIVAFGVLSSGAPGMQFVVPQALLTDTMWLESTAVVYAGALEVGRILKVLLASIVLASIAWAAATTYLRRTDARL